MRLFISVPLPKAIIEELNRLQQQLQENVPFDGKLVPLENLHITVMFFGSLAEERISKIQDQLKKIEFEKFSIKLTQIQVNSRSKPHVIWISVDSSGLTIFADAIALLFPEFKQERTFNGHITIARIKQVYDKNLFLASIESMQVQDLTWIADRFELISSITRAEGPEYSTVAKYYLI